MGFSDVVRVFDLPASAIFTYVRPQNGDANCLGNIEYEASSSILDLTLDSWLDQGCAKGALQAHVQDLPGRASRRCTWMPTATDG